jgi:hypothetical protein
VYLRHCRLEASWCDDELAETAVLPLRPPGAPSLPPVSNIMRRRSRAGRSVGTGRDGVEANHGHGGRRWARSLVLMLPRTASR